MRSLHLLCGEATFNLGYGIWIGNAAVEEREFRSIVRRMTARDGLSSPRASHPSPTLGLRGKGGNEVRTKIRMV